MMKFVISMMFFFFIFNKMNKWLIQLILQNIIFSYMFMLVLIFPLNNLNFWMKIYYYLGCDFYSLGLILLTLWVISLMFMVSLSSFIMVGGLMYLYINFFMMMTLFLCFLTMNIMMFYIFFESSLLPVFMLIIGWGYQVDRIQASFYMMLYTLVGSFPLFLMIMMIYLLNYSMMYDLLGDINILSGVIYLMLVSAFLIKMPMYFVHLWLPKAHVEAPLVGSMILAGVMLKLGSYGLMRFMLFMLNMCLSFNKFIIIISLMGGIYSSLICLCQVDMKMLVAYSSVVHMSILLGGLMTMYSWGYLGGLLMMIAHGLCSSGLFCLVNMSYERLESRSLLINKGLINYFPSLSLMWFMLCSSNLSFPPSLNLFSEIMLLNSLVLWSKNLIIILMLVMFFSASYSLYLYSFSQHGGVSDLVNFMKNILIGEYLILLLHWIPLNLLFILMYLFL